MSPICFQIDLLTNKLEKGLETARDLQRFQNTDGLKMRDALVVSLKHIKIFNSIKAVKMLHESNVFFKVCDFIY